MGNVLRFDSKREMDMMAAILIGKGKAIVPRKKRFVQNKPRWEFSVNPAIRWSSQQKYKNEIITFDQACATCIPDSNWISCAMTIGYVTVKTRGGRQLSGRYTTTGASNVITRQGICRHATLNQMK